MFHQASEKEYEHNKQHKKSYKKINLKNHNTSDS